jgi:hypothetical protein
METFWQKIKTTFSSENISKGWKITRNIAGTVSSISLFATSSACPIVFDPKISMWLGAIGLISGIIAGGAQANTSKKIINNIKIK